MLRTRSKAHRAQTGRRCMAMSFIIILLGGVVHAVYALDYSALGLAHECAQVRV